MIRLTDTDLLLNGDIRLWCAGGDSRDSNGGAVMKHGHASGELLSRSPKRGWVPVKAWVARALAGLLVASALALGSVAPASAATNPWPSATTNTSSSTNFWYCNNWTGNFGYFRVCIDATNNGYNALVYHAYGPTYTVDFNLATSTGTYGDSGAFSIAAGQTRTYFFAVGYKSWAYVILYWRAGSPYFSPLPSPEVYIS
jgi:hypothetical protein